MTFFVSDCVKFRGSEKKAVVSCAATVENKQKMFLYHENNAYSSSSNCLKGLWQFCSISFLAHHEALMKYETAVWLKRCQRSSDTEINQRKSTDCSYNVLFWLLVPSHFPNILEWILHIFSASKRLLLNREYARVSCYFFSLTKN